MNGRTITCVNALQAAVTFEIQLVKFGSFQTFDLTKICKKDFTNLGGKIL